MTAFVSNPPSGLSVFFEKDAEIFRDQHVDIKLDGKALTLTMAKSGGRKANSRLLNVASYGEHFGKTEFETEIRGNSLIIFLNRPVGTLKPEISRSHGPRVKTLTDEDVRAALNIINGLDRDVWRVMLNTTNNHVSLRRLQDFV